MVLYSLVHDSILETYLYHFSVFHMLVHQQKVDMVFNMYCIHTVYIYIKREIMGGGGGEGGYEYKESVCEEMSL